MDYFVDVLGTFLGLERGRTLAVYGEGLARELSDFIKRILICVPKMNKGHLAMRARNDRIIIFG